jgi:predicted aminopeptidase
VVRRRPIDDWLADRPPTPSSSLRLATARQIRTFAVKELGLPDNASYKNYAALKRPFVLWNVVATPELSLKPMQWCFPVAGCVNYRGYYSKDDAQAYADELRAEGNDVRSAACPPIPRWAGSTIRCCRPSSTIPTPNWRA